MSKYLDDSIDGISNDIDRIVISEDVIDRVEEMTSSEKKCTSCEQKVEHIKTHEISYNSGSSDADNTDIVSGDTVKNVELFDKCANCGKLTTHATNAIK